MSGRLVAAAIVFFVFLSAMFVNNLFVTMMIGEINRKKEEKDLISYFGFTFPKMLRIFREYRSLHPDGKLHIYALACFGLAMISLVVVAVCLHIIGC